MYYLATVNWWLYRCFFPRVLCYVVHAEALGPLSAFLSLPHAMYNLFFNNRHETSILIFIGLSALVPGEERTGNE